MGWKIVNNFPKDIKKYIIIVAPHTDWVDFPVGVFLNTISEIHGNFIGKHTLFKPPFGFIFRALGGTPIDRSKSESRVQSLIKVYNEKDEFKIALSPEGTRKKVATWKTGFYYVAKGANIPIVMVAFDYKNKETVISEPYYVTDDIKKDYQHFHEFFKDVTAKLPDQFDPNFHESL